MARQVLLIGGPNGAGKTTAATSFLSHYMGVGEFVNADEIARGLSPLNPEAPAVAAGRLFLQRIRELTTSGRSFSFETTCAGKGHVRLLRECRAVGYELQ